MLRTLWHEIPPERQRLVIAMAMLACVVFILDHFGNASGLYHADYIGYDKIVHFTAGAFSGTFGLWLFQQSGAINERLHALSVAFLLAFWVGLGWEVYETLCNQPDTGTILYWGDTMLDMVADTLLGLSVGWILWRGID